MFAKDTLNTKFSFDGKMVKLSYAPMIRRQRHGHRLKDNLLQAGNDPVDSEEAGRSEQTLPATATRLSGIKQWKRMERNR